MVAIKTLLRVLCILGFLQMLVIGVSVSAATPISFGETVTGTISTLGQMNDYTFSATSGDTIYTRMSSSWSNGALIILQYPNGTKINALGGSFTDITKNLPLTGTYTLLVGDNYGDDTGTYGLYLQRTNNPGHAEPITFGETKTGSITKPAQLNNYTFSATAGDSIYTRMSSSWSNGALIRLYAPNGTEIATAPGGSFTDVTKILPLTGTYTLLVGDNYGNDIGTYGLYLQRTNNPGHAEPITFGETKTGSITKPAQLNNYTFSATAGDSIYTRMSSSWSNGALIRLYAPNGTEIATAPGGSFTDVTKTLPLTGTYTLLVGDNYGNDIGTYGLYLQRTNNPGHAEPIVSGETKTGSITKPAQLNNYTFSATAGDSIYTRMSSSWSNGALIRLYAPNGTEIATAPGGSFTDVTKTLPLTGTYTLLVGDNYGDDTGTYGLYLQLTGTSSTITVSSPNGGETWKRGTTQTVTWDYTGSPGSYVKITRLQGGVEVGTVSPNTSIGSGGHGSFVWNIGATGTTGSDCQVKIQSISQPTVFDSSNSYFTLAPAETTPSTIIVTSPNGGETWQRGTTQTVTWDYTGDPGTFVKITRLQGGAEVGTISASTAIGTGGHGSFVWNIGATGTTGTNCRVKIQSISQPAINDTSNNDFTLAPGGSNPPTIAVTSPNGGETWQRGTYKTITWDYTGSPGSAVKIVLFKGGSEVGTIQDSWSIGSGGKGSYIWPISLFGTTGNDYKVNVQSISQPSVNDVSNNNITITL